MILVFYLTLHSFGIKRVHFVNILVMMFYFIMPILHYIVCQ